MPYYDGCEDYDSLSGFELLKSLEPPWKKALKVAGVIIGLGALVGYGIWIGTIQANITELKKLDDDVKETKEAFLSLDHRVTDRMDRFRDSFDLKYDKNRGEIGDIKDALFAFSTEMRYRHHTEPPIKPIKTTNIAMAPGMPTINNKVIHVMSKTRKFGEMAMPQSTPSPRRATKTEINDAAKKADQLIHKALH